MRENLHRSVTPHGTEILIEPLPHVRSCSLGFWVKSGSVHESLQEEGLAHMIEHTVFKGTRRYPTAEILSAASDMIGGSLDAFTSKENVCFYGKALSEEIGDLANILGELVTAPLFDPEEFVKERSVILEEIAQSEDQPDDWISELFYMNFWKESALSHPILGRPDQISHYSAEAARAFFQKTYVAPNLLISAAGNIDVDRLLEALQPIIHALPKGKNPTKPLPPVPRRFLLNAPRKNLLQTSLLLGLPLGGHQHPQKAAVGLLSQILGGGASSRLFMELREKHALCYQVGCFVTYYQDTGALQIAASCAQDKARELTKRAVEACLKLAQAGATQDELDRAKVQARTGLVFSQESTSSRMFSLAHQAIHMDRMMDLDEQMEEIASVSLEELNNVAKTYLVPDKLSLVALGTKKGGEIRKEDIG